MGSSPSLPPSLPPSARRVGVSKSESSLDGDRAIQTANLKSQCIMQCRRRDIQDNASLADVHCPLDVWRTCTWSVRRPIRMHDKQRHFPTVQKPEREGGREGEIQRGRLNRCVRKSLKSKSYLGNSIPDHTEREREREREPNLYCCASEISDCLYSPVRRSPSSFPPPHTFLLSDSDRSRPPRARFTRLPI